MKILALDRSTEVQSIAFAQGGAIEARVLSGENARSASWAVKIRDFLAEQNCAPNDLDAVLVGQGPGSFAGIRAAIAFAQGIALGAGINSQKPHAVKVVGLPSVLALARTGARTAVVGDARRGLFWVVLYDNLDSVADFKTMPKEELAGYVPEGYAVVTPDGARIGELLTRLFGERFMGNAVPHARRLVEIALARPDLVQNEPLPVYLSPAVRTS